MMLISAVPVGFGEWAGFVTPTFTGFPKTRLDTNGTFDLIRAGARGTPESVLQLRRVGSARNRRTGRVSIALIVRRPAADPPPRIGQLVLVVVAQMPNHIDHLICALSPVVCDAPNASRAVPVAGTEVENLADDGMFGASPAATAATASAMAW